MRGALRKEIKAMEFRPFNDIRCELGESPVWDARLEALYQCDIAAKTVHRFPYSGGEGQSWTFPTDVGSIGLAESGRLVVALRQTVVLFDPRDGSSRLIADLGDAVGKVTRLNDGKVGPDGAFWVGSMDERPRPVSDPQGALFRVTADGKVEQKVTGLFTSNGLAFSPDGRHMFHTDSYGRWIDRWDLDPANGAITNRTRIAMLSDEQGRPDGGATDSEGNYWSAGISGQCVNRFAPDGRLLATYPIAVAAPTMPCFGGRDLKRLFVTSLRQGREPELLARYPLTGITLVADSPVAGSPVALFRDR
jgi:sugar lactone lactonase YvrE